jgi:hypothetical protein
MRGIETFAWRKRGEGEARAAQNMPAKKTIEARGSEGEEVGLCVSFLLSLSLLLFLHIFVPAPFFLHLMF